MSTINLTNNAEVELDSGQYLVTVSKSGFKTQTRVVTIFSGALTTEIFNLESEGAVGGNIQVNVNTPGVQVKLVPIGVTNGTGTFRVNTTTSGVTLAMRLTNNVNAPLISVVQNSVGTVSAGDYTILASKSGFSSKEVALTVVTNQFSEASVNFQDTNTAGLKFVLNATLGLTPPGGSASETNGSFSIYENWVSQSNLVFYAPALPIGQDGLEVGNNSVIWGNETFSNGSRKFKVLEKNKNYVAVFSTLPTQKIHFRIPAEFEQIGETLTGSISFLFFNTVVVGNNVGAVFKSARVELDNVTWLFPSEEGHEVNFNTSRLEIISAKAEYYTIKGGDFEKGEGFQAIDPYVGPDFSSTKPQKRNVFFFETGFYSYTGLAEGSINAAGRWNLPTEGATYVFGGIATTTAAPNNNSIVRFSRTNSQDESFTGVSGGLQENQFFVTLTNKSTLQSYVAGNIFSTETLNITRFLPPGIYRVTRVRKDLSGGTVGVGQDPLYAFTGELEVLSGQNPPILDVSIPVSYVKNIGINITGVPSTWDNIPGSVFVAKPYKDPTSGVSLTSNAKGYLGVTPATNASYMLNGNTSPTYRMVNGVIRGLIYLSHTDFVLTARGPINGVLGVVSFSNQLLQVFTNLSLNSSYNDIYFGFSTNPDIFGLANVISYSGRIFNRTPAFENNNSILYNIPWSELTSDAPVTTLAQPVGWGYTLQGISNPTVARASWVGTEEYFGANPVASIYNSGRGIVGDYGSFSASGKEYIAIQNSGNFMPGTSPGTIFSFTGVSRAQAAGRKISGTITYYGNDAGTQILGTKTYSNLVMTEFSAGYWGYVLPNPSGATATTTLAPTTQAPTTTGIPMTTQAPTTTLAPTTTIAMYNTKSVNIVITGAPAQLAGNTSPFQYEFHGYTNGGYGLTGLEGKILSVPSPNALFSPQTQVTGAASYFTSTLIPMYTPADGKILLSSTNSIPPQQSTTPLVLNSSYNDFYFGVRIGGAAGGPTTPIYYHYRMLNRTPFSETSSLITYHVAWSELIVNT